MWYLLFRGDPVAANSDLAGAFAEGGSAMGGVRGQLQLGQGFSIFGGLAIGQEGYANARVGVSPWGALTGRYVAPTAAAARPFAEVGGWLAPGVPLQFSRNYANGAGTVQARGDTTGSLGYVFGRIGEAWRLSPRDEWDPAVELGFASLGSGGYQETLSPGNPFPAAVSGGRTSMTIAKLESTWTHDFSEAFDGSIYGAYAHAWTRPSGIVASVDGVGTFRALSSSSLNWGEYGVRVGYRLSQNIKLNGFVDGIVGDKSVGGKLHIGIGVDAKF